MVEMLMLGINIW